MAQHVCTTGKNTCLPRIYCVLTTASHQPKNLGRVIVHSTPWPFCMFAFLFRFVSECLEWMVPLECMQRHLWRGLQGPYPHVFEWTLVWRTNISKCCLYLQYVSCTCRWVLTIYGDKWVSKILVCTCINYTCICIHSVIQERGKV